MWNVSENNKMFLLCNFQSVILRTGKNKPLYCNKNGKAAEDHSMGQMDKRRKSVKEGYTQ